MTDHVYGLEKGFYFATERGTQPADMDMVGIDDQGGGIFNLVFGGCFMLDAEFLITYFFRKGCQGAEDFPCGLTIRLVSAGTGEKKKLHFAGQQVKNRFEQVIDLFSLGLLIFLFGLFFLEQSRFLRRRFKVRGLRFKAEDIKDKNPYTLYLIPYTLYLKPTNGGLNFSKNILFLNKALMPQGHHE